MQNPDDLFDAADEGESTAIVSLDDVRALQDATAPDHHLLVRMKGAQTGQVVSLGGEQWKVGRHRASDLWLGDGGISRAHARFVWDGEGYVIEDLGSANGTYVNGRRVERHKLEDGEILQFGPSAVFRYSRTDATQAAMLHQLYTTSVTDSLTGAFNREHFDGRLDSELSYARRHGTELSLILIDVDHFKSVNDTYGHPTGDAALLELSRTISGSTRTEDLFARYGGEEFAVILRNIDIEGAARVAERFRELVAEILVRHGPHEFRITASFGCAALRELPKPSPEALVAIADRRLYAAKGAGRNRVVATD